jgi:hypothetical protein
MDAFKRAHRALRFITVPLCIIASLALSFKPAISSEAVAKSEPAEARVIAVGISGAGAIAPVGFFQPGGPVHDQPALAEFTRRGHVLDPSRILVASSSNFGAPRARGDRFEGSMLSVDPSGDTIIVPSGFAASGGQASALHGRVQIFATQSRDFSGTYSPPSVSNPLGISVNNAFGFLSFVNAPWGFGGHGTVSMAGAGGKLVSATANPRAMAAVMLGPFPEDGGSRVAFAVLTADGAILQMREGHAVEVLAPPSTVCVIGFAGIQAGLQEWPPCQRHREPEHPAPFRAGMIYRWFPDRMLFAADPARNAVVALPLVTYDNVFRAGATRFYRLPELDAPIDLAPAVPEAASPVYASNTTLARGSDIYVANRGNGTVLRMRQDGVALAVRKIILPGGRELGPDRLNGITVSPEAQRIWVTVGGSLPGYPDAPGAVLEIPAFSSGQSKAQLGNGTVPASHLRLARMATRGGRLFGTSFTPEQGLGPLYNARSCTECHRSPRPGGMGPGSFAAVRRIGRRDGRSFDPLIGHGGPVARSHTVAGLGMPCSLAAGPPVLANVISTRNTPPLFGLGLIEAIQDEAILAEAAKRGQGAGRPNIVTDRQGTKRPGRFGWKADTASLEQFVAEAFRNELGMTNPLAPIDLVPPLGDCGGAATAAIELDGTAIRAVAAFIASLPPPLPAAGEQDAIGRILFSAAGCAACHAPALLGPAGEVRLYSDLLLHAMGPGLNDGIVQGEASGQDWRTTPLWGLGMRRRFLHDGRARSIEDAILAHDGEGRQAAATFSQLTRWEQDALLTFLLSL